MMVEMVDNDAFSGSYMKDPFNFKHYSYWIDFNNDVTKAYDLCVKTQAEMKNGKPWVVAGKILDVQTATVLCVMDELVLKYGSVVAEYDPEYFEDLDYLRM